MSYDPDRENQTELFSAWSTTAQTLPNKSSGTETDFNLTLTLNTVGEGDITISSDEITLAETGQGAFFIGDVRSTTAPTTASGDIYEIHFNSSTGDYSSAYQQQRSCRNDDQCYSLGSSALLKYGYALRSGGSTLTPWVRVLGLLVEA